jgi:ribosomal protein L20A (L18A)
MINIEMIRFALIDIEEINEMTKEDIEELKRIRKRIGNIIHGKTER